MEEEASIENNINKSKMSAQMCSTENNSGIDILIKHSWDIPNKSRRP
jgi:hypothetical protein